MERGNRQEGLEYRVRHKNGEWRWHTSSANPKKDDGGAIVGYDGVARDITKRKQAEEALRKSEERYARLSSLTYEAVIIHENGVLIDANKAIEKITGYSREELIGKNLIQMLVPQEYHELLIKNLKIDSVLPYEIEAIRKDGTIVPIEMESRNIVFEAKNNRVRLTAVRDITERKKAEQELIIAKEKAQESERLKSAFLANMSHEIRTPMNGILGFTELLKDPTLTEDKKNKYIEIIEKSGKRLLDTINDIIDISKIEAGQVEVVYSEISVNEILREHFDFFQLETKSKGVELIYTPSSPDNEIRTITDKHKLEGILTNLIKNAIKFTDSGSITLGYSMKNRGGKDFIEFYVKDTGVGIPANRLEAIFNRFEQADSGDTRAFQGSGLGLAISKSYIEMLGGEIWVSSQIGRGSTFTFIIPYNRPNLKESSAIQNKEDESGASIKNVSIIVAEDEEINRILIERILKNQVKRLIITSNGKEALEKFRENPDTDIILMDIDMPEMNGYDATREIRKFNTDVVIIAQTAYGLPGDREKALEAGCNDYIAKPFTKGELIAMIQKYSGF